MERVRSPTDLTVRAWWHALRDAGKAFSARNLSDRAAALTYYSILSVFPGLLVLVSLLGVLGDQGTVDALLRIADELGPSSARETLEPALESIVESDDAAAVGLVVGSAVALYSASGYIGAFIRASNEVWAVEESRPFWKLRPLQLVITLAMIVVLTGVLFLVVVGGPLADALGSELGVGDALLQAWAIARWPLVFAVVVLVVALLYRFAPDARHQGFRWLLPGALVATVLWLVASVGFNLYVTNFGSYANTYGSLAGVVIFLIWLWLTNLAIVFGAQFAEELERTGEAARAAPAGEDYGALRSAEAAHEPGTEEREPEGYSPAPGTEAGAASSGSGSASGPGETSAPARRQ